MSSTGKCAFFNGCLAVQSRPSGTELSKGAEAKPVPRPCSGRWPPSTSRQSPPPGYLFQAELELSCRACRAAWNRGRSLSTGELMKRGLGLRKEPILWNSVGRLGAKPRVISPGEGSAFSSGPEGSECPREGLLPGLPSGSQDFLKPQI